MTQGPILGSFVRASGKFFHINAPSASGLKFRQRGGTRRSVVAVFDPVRKDYRIKLWLDESAPAGHEAVKSFEHETGHAFSLTHVKDGFYQGQINQAALWRMLQGKPPVDPVDQDDDDQAAARDELKDFCIETRFDLERTGGRYGGHPGSVDGFPEWMKAKAIYIDGPGRGQGTNVHLETGFSMGDWKAGDLVLLRINGVWAPGMPTASGGGIGFMYQIPPESEDEVRNYGDGLTQIAMPNEPRPPRTTRLVRDVCVFLRDNGGYTSALYREWYADARDWNYKIFGMCTAYGQRAVYESRRGATEKRLNHYQGCINRRYARARTQGTTSVSGLEWAASVGGEPAKWARNVAQLTSGLQKIDDYIERFTDSYNEQKSAFDSITARLEAREEKYADAIELLHPRA